MNSLTHLGQRLALLGDPDPNPTSGGIAVFAAKAKLYKSTSVPAEDGTGFVEVVSGNGYTTGGHAITGSDWTFAVVSNDGQITLVDQVWTAAGGPIPDIAGAYLTDNADNVLAWWERGSTVTLIDGDAITLDDLTIRLA